MTFVPVDEARVFGPDVSPWDGNVNLAVSKAYGAAFVFIKAIDGTVPAKFFTDNWQRAKDANLLQAPYGWLYRDANVSCVAQARAYHALIERYPADLPCVIDFEWTKWYGVASNPNYSDLDKWVTEWLRLGNRKPILYSSSGYMNPLGKMPVMLRDKFSGFWFANYGTPTPLLPMGFTDWDFWQFTCSSDACHYAPNDSGLKELDMSYWNGTLAGLYEFAGTQPPMEETMSQWYKVNTTGLNIRKGAGASYEKIGLLVQDDRIEVIDAPVGGWLHIAQIIRVSGEVVVISDAWCSGAYCVKIAAPVVIPPPPVVEPGNIPDVVWIGATKETVQEYRKVV